MGTFPADNEQMRQSDNTYFCLHEGEVYLFPFGTKELYSEDYLKWMNDVEVTKTLGRFDYLMPVGREKLVEYYKSIDRDRTIFLAIYIGQADSTSQEDKKDDKKFIGTLKIYDIDMLAKRASIGIAIGDRASWGKGYATASIHIACKYCFEVLSVRKITAGYIANNIAMERAFIKNGFEAEAVFKEHLYYEGEFVDHKFVCKFKR